MSDREGKGQTAIEYTVTYSWVILVVVIGLIVVWKMDAFKTQTPEMGTVGFSQVYVNDFALGSSSNQLQINVKSDAGAPIVIPVNGINTTIERAECGLAPTVEITLNPGEDAIVLIDCSGPPSVGSAYNPDDFYQANIFINYSNKISSREHYSRGKVFGPVEAS